MNKIRFHGAGIFLLCLLALFLFPTGARAYEAMTTSEVGVELIKRYESFSPNMYFENGHWYVGYGSQVNENAYPNGVTEAEAEALLRAELRVDEDALNAFFARNDLSPTQGQFDALVDFSYTLGTSWLSGDSALVRLVRGETELDRRETARAFGVWSHAGGAVQPGLATRRLEEAALYMDGSTDGKDEFVYLGIRKESGATLATDFAVYVRGGSYDAFPVMYRLGYTFSGFRASDGTMIHLGDYASGSRMVSAVWEKNVYTQGFYSDVSDGEWFYDYVMELNESGVVSGRDGGLYAPDESVTTGEALKLILLTAGYAPQDAVDAHWASGYAALGRSSRFLPEALFDDLDRPIKRIEVAELAAKAIGFGQSFRESPFADVTDGYVTALADVGVLQGSVSQGESFYHPDDALTRAEVATIVWRLGKTLALGTRQTVRYNSRDFEVVAGVPLNDYDSSGFSGSGKTMTYFEPGVTVLRGIDVSRFQGDINWQKVASDGVEFAILRVGGRSWGPGEIYDDARFEEYYSGATAAGVRIGGVYFFSQAINVEEALEEAEFVLSKLEGKTIDGPIIFDWETTGDPSARTEGLPVSLLCDCAVAYCERAKAAGYSAMIYMNTHDGYVKYDLARLKDYDIWYAGQYGGAYPQFVYDFCMWQYTDKGSVDGIAGKVDMDLWFFRQ